ncbi:MAG: cytidylate kinase-like family protein [Synergistaceae bacterium]
MTKVISISREFASGGREIGKKLAERLSFAYYDKEVINEIAKDTNLSKEYLDHYSESNLTRNFPITIGHSFGLVYPMITPSDEVYKQQIDVMKKLAGEGDCVFIGRCSDYILRNMNILRVFIYSTKMEEKIDRCKAKANVDELISDTELKKRILKVDRDRKEYYEYYTSLTWGDVKNYDLCINTARFSVDEAVEIIAKAITKI